MGTPVDNETTIRRALEHANFNVLRMALYHATGDPDLAKMKVNKIPLRGGAFFGYVLADEHIAELKDKATAYLLTQPSMDSLTIPPDAELRSMLSLMTSEPLTDGDFQMGREELALEDFPRTAEWTGERPARADDYSVVIVGAGASGIAAAIQFERLGITYIIIERQSDIGGTWNLNHYPDARVDTSSYLYQFKFEKNYPWSEYFATQGEIKRYLEHVARKYNVYEKIRFSTTVKEAHFNEVSSEWNVELLSEDGRPELMTAGVIISAAGQFSVPKMPDIPGIDDFRGDLIHTAAWKDGYDSSGKRLAIIGNGSTGVQIMAGLASTAEHMLVFQRTPQWISPMEGYRDLISDEVRWLFDNVPGYWNWFCYSSQTTTAGMQGAQEYDRAWQAMGGQISERNDGLRSSLTAYAVSKLASRPDLVKKVLPDYAPLARRLVVDNGWYEALTWPNVELVTDGISRITANSIITTDGVEHPVDTIIAAAGFHATSYLSPTEYRGRGGTSIAEFWEKDGPRAFIGLTVPGFPNMFMFYGPNSQTRAGSFMSWIEIWARYTAQAVVGLIERGGKSLDVKQEVFDKYNHAMDEGMKAIIWEKEGPQRRNYFINRWGRQNVQPPWRNGDYYLMLAEPNFDHYTIT